MRACRVQNKLSAFARCLDCSAAERCSHMFGIYHRHHYRATHELLQLSRIRRFHHAAKPQIYGNLDYVKNEIRVIKIAPGRWDDELFCRLKVVSLDRFLSPRYDTLSYTWGSSKTTRTIRVDKQSVDVSANLFIALRALRRTFRTVTIWADALCIDQENNSEKSTQVALMGRIYKQGRQTWVSFGCPDERWADGSWAPASHLTENARLLRRLGRGAWRLLWHHLILRRSPQARLGVNHISDACRLMRSVGHEDNLDDQGLENRRIATSMLTWLACHDYWSRVWIVQEIALSHKDPICIFGRHQVPLLSLDTVFSDWAAGVTRSTEARRAGWSPAVGRGVDRAQEICMLCDEILSIWTLRLSGSMGLLRALQFASYRRASVAHDHVYGLRSLLPAIEQESLQPDYNLSIPELYASVTSLLLRQGNSVSLLCAAVGTSQQNEHNLPSWSLNFSKPLRLPLHSSGLKDCEDPNGHESTGFDSLRLHGKNLGEQVTTPVPRDYTFDGLTHSPEVSTFLIGNIYEEDTYRRGWGVNDIDTEVDWQQRHGPSFVEQSAGPANAANRTSEPRSRMGQKYAVFLTDQARLGKCANEVQKDDEIWAFAGSTTAFVLRPVVPGNEEGRPSGNRYRLVGPCNFLGHVSNTVHTSGSDQTQSIEIV